MYSDFLMLLLAKFLKVGHVRLLEREPTVLQEKCQLVLK